MDRLTKRLIDSIDHEKRKKTMINLTSFSRSELETLLNAVSHYMEDQDAHANHYVKYNLNSLPVYSKQYEASRKEVTNCKILAIQVINAIQIVSDRAKVNAN